MPSPGNWNRVIANGIEITSQQQQINYKHLYGSNAVMPDNVGVQQYAPGPFDPTLQLQGIYDNHGPGVLSAHNLLSPAGVGNVNDVEFIISELLGMNGPAGIGDCAVLYDGTLLDFPRLNPLANQMTANAQFKSRGKRMPPFPIIIDINTAIKTATNFSSAPYDDGAESSAGTTAGGVVVLQAISPTGTAATGTISLTGQPSDGDQFTLGIGGTNYVYTFKTALTPTAGQVLIGTTVAATAANLFAAMTGGIGAGTQYAAGTIPIPTIPSVNFTNALVFVSLPSATQVITLTAVNTGTAANAYTLAATVNVSTKLVVSGATMAGGVAGDTYNVTVGTSTTSGGAYTTIATFSGVGAVRQALRVEVAIGTLLNEFWKVTYTLATGPGTVQTWSGIVIAGRYFQL